MSPRPGSTTNQEASVEYRLLRDTLAKAIRLGKVAREDHCDAHPELIRAAKNIGRGTKERCPVCDGTETVEVTYVFGAKLPAGGTCPATKAELNRLLRRAACQDPLLPIQDGFQGSDRHSYAKARPTG